LILSVAWASTAGADGPTEAEQIADLQAKFVCLSTTQKPVYVHLAGRPHSYLSPRRVDPQFVEQGRFGSVADPYCYGITANDPQP
jgi:hypothetical protein